MTATSGGLSPLDWGMLALLLISVLLGVWRGLVFEVLSLGGWVLAWLVALHAGAQVGEWLHVGTPGSLLRMGVGFLVAFAATLLACGIAARLVKAMVAATPLSGLDRLLGAGFGLLRGLLLLLVLVTVVGWTPLVQARWWQDSAGVQLAAVVQQGLKPWLPAKFSLSVPAPGS